MRPAHFSFGILTSLIRFGVGTLCVCLSIGISSSVRASATNSGLRPPPPPPPPFFIHTFGGEIGNFSAPKIQPIQETRGGNPGIKPKNPREKILKLKKRFHRMNRQELDDSSFR